MALDPSRSLFLLRSLFWKSVRFFRMTQKPRKGDFMELKSKTFPRGAWPRTPLEAYAFGACCFGNRSLFILDPCLLFSIQNVSFMKTMNGLDFSRPYCSIILREPTCPQSSFHKKHGSILWNKEGIIGRRRGGIGLPSFLLPIMHPLHLLH